MRTDFQALLEVLVKQRDLFLELLRALEEIHGALEHYRAERVDGCNKTIETLKLQSDALEQARQNLVRDLAGKIGKSPENTTLSVLAAAAPPSIGREFLSIKSSLENLLSKIAAQNEKNHVLARASFSLIQSLGRILRDVSSEPVTYEPFTGRKTAPKPSFSRSL